MSGFSSGSSWAARSKLPFPSIISIALKSDRYHKICSIPSIPSFSILSCYSSWLSRAVASPTSVCRGVISEYNARSSGQWWQGRLWQWAGFGITRNMRALKLNWMVEIVSWINLLDNGPGCIVMLTSKFPGLLGLQSLISCNAVRLSSYAYSLTNGANMSIFWSFFWVFSIRVNLFQACRLTRKCILVSVVLHKRYFSNLSIIYCACKFSSKSWLCSVQWIIKTWNLWLIGGDFLRKFSKLRTRHASQRSSWISLTFLCGGLSPIRKTASIYRSFAFSFADFCPISDPRSGFCWQIEEEIGKAPCGVSLGIATCEVSS
jgi:hypothetical protein